MRKLELGIAVAWFAIALPYEWPRMPGWQHLYFEVAMPALAILFVALELGEEVRRRVARRDAALDS
jgi:hypothetical protein